MKRLITSSSTLWSCLIAMVMMMASQSAWAEYVKLTALDGTGGTGGEGFASLVDAKVSTKMGHSFDPNNPERNQAWIVVKAEKAVVPEWYFLVTGGDTGSYPTRNWKSWNIYGGNFNSDDDAVRNVDNPTAAGWTLIDSRENEDLPEENNGHKEFSFNQGGNTAYQYFWIEITESVQGTDIWLQMAEWGLGSYGDFEQYVAELEEAGTPVDEPVGYTIISGDRNNGDGEGLSKLFDGRIDTKWGNGLTAKNYGETTNGAYFIIKTSRKMAPTYYKLVTGTDNASWKHRNWNTWQIYGMDKADVPSDGKPTRASDKWVLLDRKDNISEEVLPDKNMFTVLFDLSEDVTEKYQYFKVEIDRIMSGGGYMQMSEFSLGDQYTFALDRNAIVEAAEATYDPDLFAEKALIDQLGQAIEDTRNSNDPFALGDLNATIDDLTSKVATSASQYAELTTTRNQAINLINEDNLDESAMLYAQMWISELENVAPNNEFPVGNYGYIKANRQITGAEAVAEAKRVSSYLLGHLKIVDDPIGDVVLTALDGSGGFGNEDHSMLIDGDRENTKWCSNNLPGWMIFKSEKPIKPTYYGLVTGGDTDTYKDRNWKSWKIYAANFESDEQATKDAEAWVLIDDKNNVGTDILKTTNKFESYIYLSEGCQEEYQYFMIKDVYAWGGLMQMNEFTFYNQGDFNEYRESFLLDFEDYDPDEIVAYQGYIDDYKQKYQELAECGNAPDLMKLKNELSDLQIRIDESAALYEDYESWYEELLSAGPASEELEAWFNGYTEENIAPNNIYINGTHDYIVENKSLDNEAIGRAAGWETSGDSRKEILPSGEIGYIQSMINAANDGLYILLDGHTEGQWGDGFYGHLIDGIDKDVKDSDGNVTQAGTKWGGEADPNGNTYIIFRTPGKTNPFFYTLTTGNDTGAYTGRNWGSWFIYGANFEGDALATKDAEGWVLIDNRENTGQDRLHPVNEEPSYFGFSTETTEEYTYYKVVVTKAYSGNAIQMNELHFGTEEEFEEIKQQYTDEANEFEYDRVAEQALIDQYEEKVENIDEVANMEALFRINYELADLRTRIEASEKAYNHYEEVVEQTKAFIKDNSYEESEAKTFLINYLTGEDEPSAEAYPNGAAVYILENHLLADSILTDEIAFIDSLKREVVAAGFGPGADITPLILNNTFAKAGETLKDDDNKTLGRVAEGWDGYIFRTATDSVGTVYAAEFCNENKTFNVSQTLSNLKNGYYKVTLNAAFRANGDLKSFNYAPLAYANDMMTYVPVVREDAIDADGDYWKGTTSDKPVLYACDIDTPTGDPAVDSVVVNYGPWGCEGAAYAFRNGRYAITLVAKVTDGQLTIGVKNDGTKGNEWTAVGNFHAFYLGDEADAANALSEAATYNDARIEILTEVYESPVEGVEDYSSAPGFADAQKQTLIENMGLATYDAQLTIGETMQAIYETKKAYIEVFDASEMVYGKWLERTAADETGDAEEEIYGARDNLLIGAYADADAALAAKAQLFAHWPDYLEIKESQAVILQQDGFMSEIVTNGVKPYISLSTLYEALEEDEVILSFEYSSEADINNGRFMYETPNFHTDVYEEVPVLPAAAEWTKVYLKVSKGIEAYKFGSAVNHAIRWYIDYNATKDDKISLSARNFLFITEAQMKAEGGKAINGSIEGDLNGDDSVDISDAVVILDVMASDEPDMKFDLNGDNAVDISDFVVILDLMAQQ